jgi:hypothetical protein
MRITQAEKEMMKNFTKDIEALLLKYDMDRLTLERGSGEGRYGESVNTFEIALWKDRRGKFIIGDVLRPENE